MKTSTRATPILKEAICPMCDSKEMHMDDGRKKYAYCGECGIISKIADLKGVTYE